MRLLLDECVPRPLKRDLPGHDVHTVVEMGWSSKRNGELLRLMLADRAGLKKAGHIFRFVFFRELADTARRAEGAAADSEVCRRPGRPPRSPPARFTSTCGITQSASTGSD